MSNLDTMDYLIPAEISQNYHIINVRKSDCRPTFIIMSYLTEEEEQQLDKFKGQSFKLERGDKTFEINSNQLYCYGEVDFHSKEDCEQIDSFSFLNHLDFAGAHVKSRYDYENHVYHSPKKYPLWFETWHPLYLCKIAHGALGKPKRIILFRQNYDTLQKKRTR